MKIFGMRKSLLICAAISTACVFAVMADDVAASKAAYIKEHMAVENLKVEGKERVLCGTVKNRGQKAVGLVRITIYFIDDKGARLLERGYNIVSVASFIRPTEPLDPDGARDFDYYVEDYAPQGWSGKVDSEISEIKFMDEMKKEYGFF